MCFMDVCRFHSLIVLWQNGLYIPRAEGKWLLTITRNICHSPCAAVWEAVGASISASTAFDLLTSSRDMIPGKWLKLFSCD